MATGNCSLQISIKGVRPWTCPSTLPKSILHSYPARGLNPEAGVLETGDRGQYLLSAHRVVNMVPAAASAHQPRLPKLLPVW